MINIFKDKTFKAIKDDGQEVSGVLEDGLFLQIVNVIEEIKTKQDAVQEFIETKLDEMTDEEVLKNKILVNDWLPNTELEKGDLVKDVDIVYRVIKGLPSELNIYNPSQVPSEFKRIDSGDALPEYGKYENEESRDLGANPYVSGEKIAFNNQVCTWVHPSPGAWSPDEYPQAWKCE